MAACPVDSFDLLPYIDLSKSQGLNLEKTDLNQIFKPNDNSQYILSDCDEQILLTAAFTVPVKLRSLQFSAPKNSGPKNISIWINKLEMGFDDVDAPALEKIKLSPEHLTGDKTFMINMVKYTNVNSITVFVETNQQDEAQTQINRLTFVGTSSKGTNMKELRKVG